MTRPGFLHGAASKLPSSVPCARMHARPGNVLLLLAAIRGLKPCMDFWWRPTPQPSASYMEVPAAAATCNRRQLKRNTLYILDLRHARTKILENLSAAPNSTHMCLWSNYLPLCKSLLANQSVARCCSSYCFSVTQLDKALIIYCCKQLAQ
jgi:hypothetical protein